MSQPSGERVELFCTVDRNSYVSAWRLFVGEQYRLAIDACRRLVSEPGGMVLSRGSSDESSSIATVYDAIVLEAICHHVVGDLDRLTEILSYLDGEVEPELRSTYHTFASGLLQLGRGQYLDAEENANRALEIGREAGDVPAYPLFMIRGVARLRLDRTCESLQDFESGYSFARWYSSEWLTAEFANFIGVARIQLGEPKSAVRWLEEALEIGTRLGMTTRVGRNELNLGIVHYKLGDLEAARGHFLRALDALEEYDPQNTTRALIGLGNTERLSRNYAEARGALTKAYSLATKIGIPREECLSLEFLGDVFRDEGKPTEALRYYDRGLAVAEAISPAGDLVMEILRRKGECHLALGKAGEALEFWARARSIATSVGDQMEYGVILRCIADGMLAIGDANDAVVYAEQSIAKLAAIEARFEHAISRIVAARARLSSVEQNLVSDRAAHIEIALDHSMIAHAIFAQIGDTEWIRASKRIQSAITKKRKEDIELENTTTKLTRLRTDSSGLTARVIAESQPMKAILQSVDAFAPYDEPVLITGETGTGKEIIARLLHARSSRHDRPFIAVNITAIPESMFERELFGHARGAFSGADIDAAGLAEEADKGTLFLDEIGDLSTAMQSKLLRLLQDGSYLRLGDPTERRADLRIIAATNADLTAAVREGHFREDLYYRLATLELPIPALRHRPEDVRPLLDHFLSSAAGRPIDAVEFFGERNVKLLEKYEWPGNVREIAHIARRAVISEQTLGRVEVQIGTGAEAMLLRGDGVAMTAQSGGDSAEPALNRARILLALEESGGNRSEAAKMLGVSRATFYRRMARLGIDA